MSSGIWGSTEPSPGLHSSPLILSTWKVLSALKVLSTWNVQPTREVFPVRSLILVKSHVLSSYRRHFVYPCWRPASQLFSATSKLHWSQLLVVYTWQLFSSTRQLHWSQLLVMHNPLVVYSCRSVRVTIYLLLLIGMLLVTSPFNGKMSV